MDKGQMNEQNNRQTNKEGMEKCLNENKINKRAKFTPNKRGLIKICSDFDSSARPDLHQT